MSALGVTMAHLPQEGYHGLNGMKKPGLAFTTPMAGPSPDDIQLLVALLGQQGLLQLSSLCHGCPGFGLQMVGDDVINALMQEFEISVDVPWKASPTEPFATKNLLIHKFQQRCKAFLDALEEVLLPEKSIIRSSDRKHGNNFSPGIPTAADVYNKQNSKSEITRCYQCRLGQSKPADLVKCGLSCGKCFHESACKGGELVAPLSNGHKIPMCQNCTVLLALVRCVPDVLDSENKSAYLRLLMYLNATASVPYDGAFVSSFGVPAGMTVASPLPDYQALDFAARQKQLLLNQHFIQAYAPFVSCSINSLVSPGIGAQSSQTPFSTVSDTGKVVEGDGFGHLLSPETQDNKAKTHGHKSKRLKKSSSSPIKTEGAYNKKRDPTLSPVEKSMDWEDESGSKQKRTRWLSSELHNLWKGISIHGNRWYEVKNALPGRTYYQVKDKGRRLLYNQGWRTGRLKTDNDGAHEDAKAIARLVLAEGIKRKSKAPNLGEKRKTM